MTAIGSCNADVIRDRSDTSILEKPEDFSSGFSFAWMKNRRASATIA
jgi:hypothetical protein